MTRILQASDLLLSVAALGSIGYGLGAWVHPGAAFVVVGAIVLGLVVGVRVLRVMAGRQR